MAKRKLVEIPNASLADISFMVLIFFLMVSTMDTDTGLERRLPPIAPDNMDTPPIKDRNVFTVMVNAKNELLVKNEYSRIEDLRAKTKEFMANPNNEEHLPEKEIKDIPFFGEVPITKGVISLRNDVGTLYKTYLAVQNELVAAINELRDELSRQHFQKPYENLNDEQKRSIRDIYPSRISEAEPRKVGGR